MLTADGGWLASFYAIFEALSMVFVCLVASSARISSGISR
jgi:hypothetical protein